MNLLSLLHVTTIITASMAAHKPSPHRFDCPPKRASGGMAEVMKCAAKMKMMLDHACKRGIDSELTMNLVRHVFFHAIKCIDEDFEHFLIDGAVDCFLEDKSPGSKMLCNVKSSACDPKMQGPVVQCVIKEAKMHTIDMAKMMSQLGHLGLLCNKLADGMHRECKAKWHDFPPLPVK